MIGAASLSLLLFAGPPLVDHTQPPVASGQRRASEPEGARALEGWIRGVLDAHTKTRWRSRYYPARHGGGTWITSEWWQGVRIAGSAAALRVDGERGLRQIVGQALAPDPAWELPQLPSEVTAAPALRWWPTREGLVLARITSGRLQWEDGAAFQTAQAIALVSGKTLAEWSLLDHGPLEISGWPENPVSTPTPTTFMVNAIDADPVVLEDDLVRVVQCAWNGEECEVEIFPTGDGPDAFSEPPPGIDDLGAHTDVHDKWSAPQAFQYAARIEEAFASWGWDPAVWDHHDCAWQDVPEDQCKLHLFVNVRAKSEDGSPEPFDGAYHKTGGYIFLGQGAVGDLAADMQLVAHEFMHHVAGGFGEPEPTDYVYDWKFWRHDRGAINEGQADLFARFATESDELFGYFRNFAGLYPGPQRRDVSVPFRCPENITGEVHMGGRIWAAAWHDVHLALQDAGLAGPTDFPSIMLAAQPAIRYIPRERRTQFETATEIVLDEIDLSLGPAAAELARGIALERGLLGCDYVVDLGREPSVTGEGDPKSDPYDARFSMFKVRGTDEPEQMVLEEPYPPAAQHRITLGVHQDWVSVRFVPSWWHRTNRVDETLDQEELVTAALVKKGDENIDFVYDAETTGMTNDADFVVVAVPEDPTEPGHQPNSESGEDSDGPVWYRIDISDLEPGETYTIALVSQSRERTKGRRHLIDRIEWEVGPPFEPAIAQLGCGCRTSTEGPAARFAGDLGMSVLSLGLLGLVRRRRRRGC